MACDFGLKKGYLWVGAWMILFLVISAPASAQQYATISRPRGVSYQVLQTEHFEIIFEAGYLDEAKAAVFVLNTHLPQARSLLKHQHLFHMPVVLNGFNDQSNGYVVPNPFKQEIEIPFLKGRVLSPGHSSWMDAVAPHELVHAVQADLRKGFGVGGVIRPFAPDMARLINLLIPQGISEGLAVYHESRHKAGAGRLNHSFFTMRFRAAMMSQKPWSMAQLVEAPAYTRPADRFYLGGAYFVDYLAEQDSLAFFHRSSNLNYRLPLLGYGVGLWYGAKKWPAKIYRAFKAEMISREEALQASLGEITEAEVLSSQKGQLHRKPRWLNNSELVFYAQGYGLRGGYYALNTTTGQRRLVRNTQPTEDFVYSLSSDKNKLFYARYLRDPFIAIKKVADLFEIDLSTGEQKRLTYNQRLLSPEPAAEGGLWAFQNDGQGNQLVRVDTSGEVTRVTAFENVRFYEMARSLTTGQLAVVVNVKGHQGIFMLDETPLQPALFPLVMFEQGAVYDLSWSPDGRRLLFTADPDGISNIYTCDMATREIRKITSARYGALEPALSPDGKTLVYVDYQHERFDLVTLLFDEGKSRRVDDVLINNAQVEAWITDALNPELPADTLMYEVSNYRALSHLSPRAVFPVIRQAQNRVIGDKKIGLGLGILLQGADPLQRLSYRVEGYGQAGKMWGEATLQAGGHYVQPYLSAYNTLSTVVAGFVDEVGAVTQGRVGQQRRGVAAGLLFPVVFEQNIFQSGMVFGGQGVIEDERFYTDDDVPFYKRRAFEPAATVFYRLQSNTRDLIPNHGLVLSLNAAIDLKTALGPKNRALLARFTGYMPYLQRANIGLKAYGALLTQNNGGIYNLDNFLPRGYEDEVYLDKGTHVVAGFEYVQPLWYVDNGLFMIPFYVKACYAFVFTEGLLNTRASFFDEDIDAFTSGRSTAVSSGAGVGIRFRVLYLFNFDVRFTGSFRYRDRHWDFATRSLTE